MSLRGGRIDRRGNLNYRVEFIPMNIGTRNDNWDCFALLAMTTQII